VRGTRVDLVHVAAAAPDSERFEIRSALDGSIVGHVELSRIARGNFQSAYLGYAILPPHRERGYMTEALQLALKHAFRTLRLHRAEANIEPGNEPSIALVRRAGFTREGFSRRYLKHGGRWRDHERWALLSEDWRPAGRTRARRARPRR
jgi:ribosomal-protein-alanine N-acetyltransferase